MEKDTSGIVDTDADEVSGAVAQGEPPVQLRIEETTETVKTAETAKTVQSVAHTGAPVPVIVARSISKAFGAKVLWKNLSFELAPGQMVALTGVSGSGKTTLLNVLGLLEKAGGSLSILGAHVGTISWKQRERLYRETIAFLFQNYALVDSWTVEQNLDVALGYAKKNRQQKTRAKTETLERLGIGAKCKEKVYTLSGGEQQRVALARLLLKKPSVVLADEPTAALDPHNSEIVFEILEELKAAGTVIVVSTHDEQVANRCDRVLRLGASPK